MKLKTLASFAAALVLCTPAAHSAVIYDFSFYNIYYQSGTHAPPQSFNINLRYDDYVTVTGMNQLAAALPGSTASLGYPITFAGTNNRGWWGLSSNMLSTITDSSYNYEGHSLLFYPTNWQTSYFDAAGTYSGSVYGNALTGFMGQASLIIREDNGDVPEPGSLALLALGIAGLACARRHRGTVSVANGANGGVVAVLELPIL